MNTFFRGTSVRLATVFYNYLRQVVQPSGAQVNVSYWQNGQQMTSLFDMVPPSGDVTQWTLILDTRGFDPGVVSWSIHTEDGAIPYGVEDNQFQLTANQANLRTF